MTTAFPLSAFGWGGGRAERIENDRELASVFLLGIYYMGRKLLFQFPFVAKNSSLN